MNNLVYTEMNADIPVIYIGVSALMFVICVIGHSVTRVL